MKKNYEIPEIEVVTFNIEDIITSSSDPDFDEGGGGLPILPSNP